MTESTSRVAVLGTGALGSAVARATATAGHPTTVWNREPTRAARLVSDHPALRHAPTLVDAVTEAQVVVLAVGDAAAVGDVLDAAGHLEATVVVLTSMTPDQARSLTERLGPAHVSGAAMSGIHLIGDPRALFLYAGAPATVESVRPVLQAWGTARVVGEDPGEVPVWDTALLTLNLGLLTGFYHALALLGGRESTVADVVTEYLPFTVGLLTEHAAQVETGQYPPSEGSLAVIAAAVDHAVATAEDRGVATDVPAGQRAVIARGLDAGHGEQGLASLVGTLR